ncbi:JmjC [Kalmanozyma brasiliensis GHG001]|uniref:JmjC n=1 Tax=Kalmanozyma brasiliensis (strain GHG001) TaxID=1365824 RepID=UPI002868094E|nr:JmjC [Kalmanozyma brasiliensis GHG001]KAF6767060.1 JmjC [Kalmanozyma brasiliensis GHG001]
MTHPQRSNRDNAELVEAVLAQLSQPVVESATQAEQTGFAALAAQRQIREHAAAARSIEDSEGSEDDLSSILSALTALTRLCDLKFVTFSYSSIPPVWRAVYIDAQLIKACCALKDHVGTHSEHAALLKRRVRDLDLALITAGAASTSRAKHCYDLILALQAKLLEMEPYDSSQPSQRSEDHVPPQKRIKTAQRQATRPQPSPSTQADSLIREFAFEEAPSFTDLAEQNASVCLGPFIVRKYAQNIGWSALKTGTDESVPGSWSSMEYLLQVAGPARIVPVEVGANYTRKEWGQDIMLWSDFLRHCRWDESDELDNDGADHSDEELRSDPLLLYMAQHDLSSQFPRLEQDYTLPDYVYTSPPAPKDWPDYEPPSTAAAVVTNLWIGPAGTVSPPHFDPYYNCFVQAVGFKEVWVAPPQCRPCQTTISVDHPTPANHQAHAAAIGEFSQTAVSIAGSLMTNTASVDVFDTLHRAPQHVRSAASKAVLGPGDLLYMPPGWWHSLRSLARSFSVSIWF